MDHFREHNDFCIPKPSKGNNAPHSSYLCEQKYKEKVNIEADFADCIFGMGFDKQRNEKGNVEQNKQFIVFASNFKTAPRSHPLFIFICDVKFKQSLRNDEENDDIKNDHDSIHSINSNSELNPGPSALSIPCFPEKDFPIDSSSHLFNT